MGPLLRAALVLTLLEPAFLLTQAPRGLPTLEPVPSLHVRFDPWSMNLTWACGDNTTSVQCGMRTRKRGPVTMKLQEHQCHCSFPNAVLHQGATFTVTASVGRRPVTEKLDFPNPGAQGTAAQNVSCHIYKADFMNCTWARGPAAPEKVQYFLHIRDLKSRSSRECPYYLRDARTTHVGCHLPGASAFGSAIYILVNGTSPSAAIQFFDDTLILKTIEIYDPPGNISVHCNDSQCLVQWDTPRIRLFLSNLEMGYQLDIHRQNSMQPSDHQLVEVSGGRGNQYTFLKPQPRAKHAVRMRAADSRILEWGPWSQPVEFGLLGCLFLE
ncbi:granulocyte-macrophage colony-stimulating factor receptor subunit alpha isoform X2 [Myotis yumanensis]|uniref:granulocyte-macrophage colony-stimulating factor receptor subunit alpha isoform X2 n=1 Tax=Myotis yumanensis TaxID=159337 RepID=UPI0038D4B325